MAISSYIRLQKAIYSHMQILSTRSKPWFIFFICMSLFQACKKNDEVSPISHSIYGLWTGTYTVSATAPTYVGKSYYLSFSIYSDGSITYKGKTPGNDVYAYGTWTLTGNDFSFKFMTLNYDGGYQHAQTGTATYNSSQNTFSNGIITDLVTGNKSSWTMTRVD